MKFVDLFCGIGAFHQVLKEYNAECVFASDINETNRQTYFSNYGIMPFGDITKIDEKDIPSHDILCAGFPCQPFSISGKKLGFEDTRGTLFYDVVRIIKHHLPKIVVLENVKNLMSHDKGKTLETILGILNELKYNVSYKVLDATNFGSPQKRQRIFIVCFREDLKIDFSIPLGNNKPKRVVKDIMENNIISKKSLYDNNVTILKTDYKNILPQHKIIRIANLRKGQQGDRIYSANGYGITIISNGGGSGGKSGLYDDGDFYRPLTLIECLRMNGFNEDFILPKTKTASYHQLGNTIVVDVIRTLFEEINKHIKLENK